MAKHPHPKRWEIWFCHLRSGIAGEPCGDHHVLVLSNPGARGILLAAPITTTGRDDDPCVVRIDPADSGLSLVSWIECDQIQALASSPQRFVTFRKRVAESFRVQVADAISSALGFDFD